MDDENGLGAPAPRSQIGVRALTALLCWLITTVLLAVTVPAAWVQYNLVDNDGFAALAQRAAQQPALQAALAGELATQAVRLARERGIPVDYAQVRGAAAAYTAGPAFPARFTRAMQEIHRSIFTGSGEWVVDLAPMLGDSVYQPSATDHGAPEPSAPTARLAIPVPESLRAAPLRAPANLVRWVGLGAVLLTSVFALLTLIAARRRGRALTGLGVSALLAGAAGWAGVETSRRFFNDALDETLSSAETTVRKIAGVLVATCVDSLHQWLNWTLAAGGMLVVIGVAVAVLSGLRRC